MDKIELVNYTNKHTTGKTAGRKEFTVSDIFISSHSITTGYRVSAFGRDIIAKHFEKYKIKLKSDRYAGTGRQILTLDKYLFTPYYLDKSTLILFEEVPAAELLMIDGDLDLWVQNKTFYNTPKT